MFDDAFEIVQTRLEGLHDLVVVAMCVAVAVFSALCCLLILRWVGFRSSPSPKQQRHQADKDQKKHRRKH